MENQKKRKWNGFILQGGILAFAGIIVRLIGLIRRIPLTNIIGDEGNGYYAAAYEVYAIILMISSYSLPLAVSRLVAARVSRGQYKNAKRIFKGSMAFAIVSGGIACLFMLIFANFLAGTVMSEPRSALAMQILAPTLLVVAVMGVFRGYFQGLGTMTPTAVSQIVEQIFLVIFSLLGAYLAFNRGVLIGNLKMDENFAAANGAAGGTIGCFIGAISGLAFLAFLFIVSSSNRNHNELKDVTKKTEDYTQIMRILIMTIVPVILSTVVYNISGVLNQMIFNKYMVSIGEIDLKTFQWGVYSGKYKVLINIPIALANAMCSSIVPTLANSIANHNRAQARDKVRSVIRITMMISIPCAVGLAVLGKPIVDMLFTGEIDLAAQMLYVGTASVIFYALSTLGNGILQGIGKMRIPVINALIALLLQLGALYVMLKYMNLGIFSVVYANIIFSIIMCVLNHLAIRKHLEYRQEWRRTFLVPFMAAAVMGLIAFGIYQLFRLFLPYQSATIIALVIAMIVYAVLFILLRGATEKELTELPCGRTIVKVSKLLHLIR